MKRNIFFVGMFATVLSFGLVLAGCLYLVPATKEYTRSDPLALEQKGDYAILRVQSSPKLVPFAKIDGLELKSNEVLLPAGTTEYDVKFKVRGSWNLYVIQAKVPLTLEGGQTYLLAGELPAGSKAVLTLTSFTVEPYHFVLYKYSSDLKNKTQLSTITPVYLTIGEF